MKALLTRKKIGLFFIILAFCLFAILSRRVPEELPAPEIVEKVVEECSKIPTPIGDDQAVSRGMAAKMLALIFMSPAEINSMPSQHPFDDIAGHIHFPYINAVYALGIMRGNGETFMPDAALSFGQAQSLLRLLEKEATLADIAEPSLPISYALWVELYKQLLEGLSAYRTIYEAFGISSLDIIVLATSANSPLPAGHLISDRGPLSHGGLTMDAYIDRQLRVLVRDQEIIALSALLSERPTLRNAYIVEASQEGIRLFAGGAERFFYSQAEVSGVIADVIIKDGQALSVVPLEEEISGTLLRISDSGLELSGAFLPLSQDFKVYDVSEGTVRRRSQANLIVGTNAARFFVRDGVAQAGLITHREFPEQIRVVIGTSNFAGLVHNSLSITSTGDFWVTAGASDADRLAELASGQRFTISDIENTDLFGYPRLFFHTAPEDRLQLTGLGRHNTNPRYRGVIEVAREPGGYSVVNVLCLEEYLYAVVPSEMPSGYGLEASKVQAVTARSFAVHQVMANRFHALGGNIDDSVMSQVYNNIAENDISIEAVEATRGLVLWYGDQVVQANFFSTSAGMTANSGEVWAFGQVFPGATPTFLRARPQGINNMPSSLSNEAQAAAFFRRRDFPEAYDSHSPWFRWYVEMTAAEIAASVNARHSVGNLEALQVVSRGEGGNIMELKVIGDKAEVVIVTEFNIRNALRPARAADGERDIPLRRGDGSVLLNHSMLPSAFFSFEKQFDEEGVLETVFFFGGGHGHGVGMSQNGVRGMVERGYGFEDILAHFYPGTVVGAYVYF